MEVVRPAVSRGTGALPLALELVTFTEAARRTEFHRSTIAEWVRTMRVPSYRVRLRSGRLSRPYVSVSEIINAAAGYPTMGQERAV